MLIPKIVGRNFLASLFFRAYPCRDNLSIDDGGEKLFRSGDEFVRICLAIMAAGRPPMDRCGN